jgi:glucose-1-phosphate cytidylyltransferase
MKVVILAGGLGTRLAEETETKPKPMVLIDDKPILWHIMNVFASQGNFEFVVALGYKGEVIQSWLTELSQKDETSIAGVKSNFFNTRALETGNGTQTGGRIAKCMNEFPGERVIVTYGDGLANVSIKKLLAFHESHGKLATVTAVRPPARFGHLHLEGNEVTHFGEKKQSDAGWINGGFFVLEPEVTNFIFNDNEPFETGALPRLVDDNQLMAYLHSDFWQPMDTLREKNELAELAKEMPPPWLRLN